MELTIIDFPSIIMKRGKSMVSSYFHKDYLIKNAILKYVGVIEKIKISAWTNRMKGSIRAMKRRIARMRDIYLF